MRRKLLISKGRLQPHIFLPLNFRLLRWYKRMETWPNIIVWKMFSQKKSLKFTNVHNFYPRLSGGLEIVENQVGHVMWDTLYDYYLLKMKLELDFHWIDFEFCFMLRVFRLGTEESPRSVRLRSLTWKDPLSWLNTKVGGSSHLGCSSLVSHERDRGPHGGQAHMRGCQKGNTRCGPLTMGQPTAFSFTSQPLLVRFW